MEKDFTPFPSVGYISKEYFCDREDELITLKGRIESKSNTTLISPRRYGKSALIHRFFEASNKKYICIYTDIYATQNLQEFTEQIAREVLQYLKPRKNIANQFLDVLKGFRPIITYDVLTGAPEVRFTFIQPKDCEQTLLGIFNFLESQHKNVILAIDEFQQVAHYPEKNTEALLRTIMQSLKNVLFIFSGSNKHLMLEMFNSAKRPFFSSTLMLPIPKIPEEKYKHFILQKFNENDRVITDEAVDFIIAWTHCHTFYTQVVCKESFATGKKEVTLNDVKQVCDKILNFQQSTFVQYRNLLSSLQWKLLIAIAKEGEIHNPTANLFLQKHALGASSSIIRTLKSLLEKEMIYRHEDVHSSYYQVYDVFLSRWLERTY